MSLERIFLDTNIVCNLGWILSDETFEDGFYDHYSQKFITADRELRRDCMALRYMVEKDDEFALQFVVSSAVVTELEKTQPTGKRDELLSDELLSIANELAIHFEDQLKRAYLDLVRNVDYDLSREISDITPQVY